MKVQPEERYRRSGAGGAVPEERYRAPAPGAAVEPFTLMPVLHIYCTASRDTVHLFCEAFYCIKIMFIDFCNQRKILEVFKSTVEFI